MQKHLEYFDALNGPTRRVSAEAARKSHHGTARVRGCLLGRDRKSLCEKRKTITEAHNILYTHCFKAAIYRRRERFSHRLVKGAYAE